MDIDFTALASRVAARAEVVGCVILSRDGLVLGAFPPGGERDVTPAWLRFVPVPPREAVHGASPGEPSSSDIASRFGGWTPPPPSPTPTDQEPSQEAVPAEAEEPADASESSASPEDIDRVALAREFAQLLQD